MNDIKSLDQAVMARLRAPFGCEFIPPRPYLHEKRDTRVSSFMHSTHTSNTANETARTAPERDDRS